jgi:hypothetical protein
MMVPAYELMFGKLSPYNMFEDYFDQAGNMTPSIMLKPLEDPHDDLIAIVSCKTLPGISATTYVSLPFQYLWQHVAIKWFHVLPFHY